MKMGSIVAKIPQIAGAALTAGLNEGYLGGGEFRRVSISGLGFKAFYSQLKTLRDQTGIAFYSDCFHFGEQGTGFGFDVVEFKDSETGQTCQVARVYVGGTVPKEKLEKLGLAEKDVTCALKDILKALGDQTRLTTVKTIQNGSWIYVYNILENASETFGGVFILAEESMYYFANDGSGIKEPVFTHYIILIEVK